MAKKVSPLWMNCLKASGAALFFSFFLLIRAAPAELPPNFIWVLLMLSGFIGLNLGDHCILTSYREIGTGRTMMITAFNPIFLSLAGFALFGDALGTRILLAVCCLSLVLVVLGHEHFRREKKWSIEGYLHALTGAALDAAGILITRYCFQQAPSLDPFLANWYRLVGALVGFVAIHFFVKRIDLVKSFRAISGRERGLAIFGSFLGTFLALSLWLTALKHGHMGLVSAMGGFGPLYATSVECIVERRWPSLHVVAAAAFFALGFLLIVNPTGPTLAP